MIEEKAPLLPLFNSAAKGELPASPEAGPLAKKKLYPTSIRLTFEQKARLDRDAAGMSATDYIVWRLFNPDSPPPRTRGRFPVKDEQAVAQLLAMLGQSRLANNVNQLARSANTGSLPLTPDTEAALNEAAADIAFMRTLLIQALRLDPT
jgi:hypothetical protein